MSPAPIRLRLLALRPFAMGSVALLAVGACSEVGDLGRPKPSPFATLFTPETGYAARGPTGDGRSAFHYTDDERQLRDRALRFALPAFDKPTLGVIVHEAPVEGTEPVPASASEISRYHRMLVSDGFRSQDSRYRRLADDALSDRDLIQPFRMVASRVANADRVRLRTAELSGFVLPEPRVEADWRVAENRAVVARVRGRLRDRVVAYRYALDNLVVEVPSREAIHAERAVMALEAELGWLDRLDFGPMVGGRSRARPHAPGPEGTIVKD